MLHLQQPIYRYPLFWIVFAMTSIALLLGLGLAYYSYNLSTLFRGQEDLRNYVVVTNSLKSNLLNAETGQRGYLITQDEQYLKPYSDALPLIERDLEYMKNSPLSDPYNKKVDEIVRLSNSKVAELKLTIDTLREQGRDAAFAIVSSDSGIDSMDTLRQIIGDITDDQDRQLQAKIANAQGQASLLGYLAPVVALLDIMLIVAILLLMKRAIKHEQQLDDLKEQFVALASHQLRTPATAVKQYLHLLIDGTFGKLKKEQEEVLKKVHASNERGIKVANNLLNITLADSGKVKISNEPVDISQLLLHVMTHYTEALQESRDQKLVLKIPKKPVLAKVDQFQIRLIFDNLVENASKYSDNGKSIHVTLKNTDEWIVFTVRDHGQGIRKKDLPLLFKKFSRLDEASRKTEGSGLGLYLVMRAAELHDGDVTVDSTEGKGTTFTVRIKKNS